MEALSTPHANPFLSETLSFPFSARAFVIQQVHLQRCEWNLVIPHSENVFVIQYIHLQSCANHRNLK